MKIETLICFTYEEVRQALQVQHPGLKIEGVKVGGESGYCIVTCPKTEEPTSARSLYANSETARQQRIAGLRAELDKLTNTPEAVKNVTQ